MTTFKVGDKVRVRYGTRIGQVGRVVAWEREHEPVYRGGLLPHVFPGRPGYAGSVPGPVQLIVEFNNGEQQKYFVEEIEKKRSPVYRLDDATRRYVEITDEAEAQAAAEKCVYYDRELDKKDEEGEKR